MNTTQRLIAGATAITITVAITACIPPPATNTTQDTKQLTACQDAIRAATAAIGFAADGFELAGEAIGAAADRNVYRLDTLTNRINATHDQLVPELEKFRTASSECLITVP